MLEVLGEVDLLLRHLLDPPDLHALLLLELLLLHEGLLGLALLLELVRLLGRHLLVLDLLLLLLLEHLLLLGGELLLGLLLDELVRHSSGVDAANSRLINNPTVRLLFPLIEEFSTCLDDYSLFHIIITQQLLNSFNMRQCQPSDNLVMLQSRFKSIIIRHFNLT